MQVVSSMGSRILFKLSGSRKGFQELTFSVDFFVLVRLVKLFHLGLFNKFIKKEKKLLLRCLAICKLRQFLEKSQQKVWFRLERFNKSGCAFVNGSLVLLKQSSNAQYQED